MSITFKRNEALVQLYIGNNLNGRAGRVAQVAVLALNSNPALPKTKEK
jgi:hypothetical protein